jgi:hypothetical protein
MRITNVYLPAVITAAIVSVLAHADGISSSKRPETNDESVAVILSGIESRCRMNEKCQLVVTFANLGSEPVYLPQMPDLFIELRDSHGKSVMRAPSPEPPPPPADNYMLRSGERVLMQPVWKLEPLGGAVVVLPDVAKGYRDNLKKGQYSVHIPLRHLNKYSREQVIIRENVKARFWVRADESATRIEVSPNTVSIEIE